MSYEFKPGDKGRLHGGGTYEVVAKTRLQSGKQRLFIKYVFEGSSEDTRTMDGSGRQFPGSANLHRGDLLPPTQTRTIYVNVYGGATSAHDSAIDAEKHATANRALGAPLLASAVPVTLELTPGCGAECPTWCIS